jgi:hypothetical protein
MQTKKKPSNYPLGFWIFVTSVFAVIFAEMFSKRMPYLLNMHKVWMYFYVSFPSVLTFFIYFVFFHKWKTTGLTGFQMRFSNQYLVDTYITKPSKPKGPWFYIICITILSAFLAWYSWSIMACGAYFYSKDSFQMTYLINDLTDRGNSGVDVELVDTASGDKYLLKQKGYSLTLKTPWRVGDYVCAKGRTSFLGTIVDDFKTGECITIP